MLGTILMEAQVQVHQQHRFAGLLEVVAAAGRRLHAPCYAGSLLRDPGTDAWYLTTLFDTLGRPAELSLLGVPLGPFPFTLPTTLAFRPLADLLGEAWGPERCAGVESQLGTAAVLCVPIEGTTGPCGALLALFSGTERAMLVGSVLTHAATAAARYFHQEHVPLSDGVLDVRAFTEQAASEVARATRYGRQLAIVTFELDSVARLGSFGPQLVRALRQWDILGRLESEQPALAAMLPETGRDGGRGLIQRLGVNLTGIRTGAAIFPNDARSLEALVEFARGRGGRVAALEPALISEQNRARAWVRGAPAGPGSDTVRCPHCAASYSRVLTTSQDDETLEFARAAARGYLQAHCPRHGELIAVDDGSEQPERRKGRLFGRLGRRA
jgi:hypothetical protein